MFGTPKFTIPDFGANETVIVNMHSGMQLRCESFDANPDGVSYLRVCDPDGDEIGYWSSDEWRDDPQHCMGAIIGALGTRQIATKDRYVE